MAKTVKWYSALAIISRALLDPLVVVTAMTTLGSVVAILALVGSAPSKKVFALCLVIVLIGLLTLIYQVRRLVRLDRARVLISDMLAEGQQRALAITSAQPTRDIFSYPSQTFEDLDAFILLEDWCKDVENVLRLLGASYVTRFHLGGSLQQDERSMTIWKTRHRLETLAGFLTELK